MSQLDQQREEWQRWDWQGWTGKTPEKDILSGDLCAWVRQRTDTVLLGLSFGKDSLAAFLRLREHFDLDKIIGYHLYVVPRLGFQERSLSYYRRTLGIKILNLPNRSTFRMLNDGVQQAPQNLPVIWGAGLPDLEYRDLYWHIADAAGVNDRMPWVAQGVRAADSPQRRMNISSRGPWVLPDRVFYPVWDWRKADVRAALSREGVRLPVDYRLFGRTFDGIDHRFLAPLREEFPEDYQRVCDWFPLAVTDELRRRPSSVHIGPTDPEEAARELPA